MRQRVVIPHRLQPTRLERVDFLLQLGVPRPRSLRLDRIQHRRQSCLGIVRFIPQTLHQLLAILILKPRRAVLQFVRRLVRSAPFVAVASAFPFPCPLHHVLIPRQLDQSFQERIDVRSLVPVLFLRRARLFRPVRLGRQRVDRRVRRVPLIRHDPKHALVLLAQLFVRREFSFEIAHFLAPRFELSRVHRRQSRRRPRSTRVRSRNLSPRPSRRALPRASGRVVRAHRVARAPVRRAVGF